MEDKVLKDIYEALQRGEKSALVSVTEMKGSTPGKKGSIMAVNQDGRTLGTVGGGAIEFDIIKKALECIANEEDKEHSYQLNETGDLGMRCGGLTKVYIKVFIPRPKLLIVGGGHIGIELFKLAKVLDFYTVILDDREDYANSQRFEGAEEIILGDTAESLRGYLIDNRTYIALLSRGHRSDMATLKEIAGSKAAYIGMVGSKKKAELVFKTLVEEGISRESLEKVYVPIGLNISNGEPKEIALGIMSEILLVKNKGTLQHLKDIKGIMF
jgi:xanthine dehydrogenase accessory factor